MSSKQPKRRRGRPKGGPIVDHVAKLRSMFNCSERTAYRYLANGRKLLALPEAEQAAVETGQKTMEQAFRDNSPPLTLIDEIGKHLNEIGHACERLDRFLNKYDTLSGLIADERWNPEHTELVRMILHSYCYYLNRWLEAIGEHET